MPEVTHEQVNTAIREVTESFTAVEHFRGKHIPLLGPEILYVYKEPQRAIEQGLLSVFKAGDVPVIVMVVEKYGDKIVLQAAKITDERVEMFYKGHMFTNLENNYTSHTLSVSPSPGAAPPELNVVSEEDVFISEEDIEEVGLS